MSEQKENNIDIWNKAIELSSREYVMRSVHEQLLRDFAKAGIQLNFEVQEDTKLWVIQIEDALKALTEAQTKHLVYVIDLPENWYNQTKTGIAPTTQLAEAILYRELTKIYYKIQYSRDS